MAAFSNAQAALAAAYPGLAHYDTTDPQVPDAILRLPNSAYGVTGANKVCGLGADPEGAPIVAGTSYTPPQDRLTFAGATTTVGLTNSGIVTWSSTAFGIGSAISLDPNSQYVHFNADGVYSGHMSTFWDPTNGYYRVNFIPSMADSSYMVGQTGLYQPTSDGGITVSSFCQFFKSGSTIFVTLQVPHGTAAITATPILIVQRIS